jgi:hypothetical protein
MHGANAELDSDLDGDGLSLIQEFVFNKDPSVPDGTDASFAFKPKLNPLAEPGSLSLIFGARADAPVRYWAEFSSDLVTWDRLPEPIDQPFINDNVGTRALFLINDPVGGPKRFGKIVIEPIPRP